MAKPTQDVIIWAAQDVNLPALNGPNKTLPITDLLNKGWDKNQKPAADEFNYVLNNIGLYINWLTTEIADPVMDATSLNTPSTIVLRDGSGNFNAGTITAALNGNANTADKWKTAKTLTLNGSVSGSASMDGSGNVTLNTSITSSGVSIVTGYLASGETIPLPSGYTEAQCKWTTSLRTIDATNDMSDIYVLLNGRIVTVSAESGETVTNATAWYMCIGVK